MPQHSFIPTAQTLIHAPAGTGHRLLGPWVRSINWFLNELSTAYPCCPWLPRVEALDHTQLMDGLNQYLILDSVATLAYLDPIVLLNGRRTFFLLKLARTVTGQQYHDRWIALFRDERHPAVGRVSSFVAFTGRLGPRENPVVQALASYREQLRKLPPAQAAEQRPPIGSESTLKVTVATPPPTPPPTTSSRNRATRQRHIERHLRRITHDLPPEIATWLRVFVTTGHPPKTP